MSLNQNHVIFVFKFICNLIFFMNALNPLVPFAPHSSLVLPWAMFPLRGAWQTWRKLGYCSCFHETTHASKNVQCIMLSYAKITKHLGLSRCHFSRHFSRHSCSLNLKSETSCTKRLKNKDMSHMRSQDPLHLCTSNGSLNSIGTWDTEI